MRNFFSPVLKLETYVIFNCNVYNEKIYEMFVFQVYFKDEIKDTRNFIFFPSKIHGTRNHKKFKSHLT